MDLRPGCQEKLSLCLGQIERIGKAPNRARTGCSVQSAFEIADAPRTYSRALGQLLLSQAGRHAPLLEQFARARGLLGRHASILLTTRGRQ
jgi:hypothetical protein